jgi:hypothetical protein
MKQLPTSTSAISVTLTVLALSIAIASYGSEPKAVKTSDPSVAKTAKTPDLYVVEQTESNGNKRTICLSESGIKVIANERVLIATAPEWNNILISNRRSHRFCKVALKEFDGCDWFEKLPVHDLKQQSDKEDRPLAGQPVARYSEVDTKEKGTVEKSAILVSTKLPVTDKTGAVLNKLFGTGHLSGLPLSVKVTTANGGIDERLATLWCLGRTLPKSFFTVPKTFKVETDRDKVESASQPYSRDKKRAVIFPK